MLAFLLDEMRRGGVGCMRIRVSERLGYIEVEKRGLAEGGNVNMATRTAAEPRGWAGLECPEFAPGLARVFDHVARVHHGGGAAFAGFEPHDDVAVEIGFAT